MSLSLLVRGACPHDCPDTCGVITEVRDGRAVSFRGDPENPVTRGWLCAKVRPYLDHVYHPDRLTHPLRRVGPKGGGRWERVSWADALKEIGDRWKHIVATYGAEAILPYSYSGTLGLVQMSVCNARFWNRLGASQLQRSICGAAAERAVEATLGARWSQPYGDVVHSRLVILWGNNPISTGPHFMPFLQQARRRGCRMVVIDPRRTPTAKQADWHLAPRPGTDGVLAMGLAHLIVAAGKHDDSWIAAHTVGWPQLRERLAEFPPTRVADETGLSESDVRRLADLYATTRPGLIKISDGINRNRNGGQNVRAILTLPAITGQYGTRGGGLAYSTSGYSKWDTQAVQKMPPLTRVVNMNRLGAALCGEVTNPPIMSLYVFGANPATSSPNAGKIVGGLKREDLFTVVHELFMTDTADYADLVLPATSQLEQTDLHRAYGTTLLTYNAPAIAPLGECKSNWEVMGLLAGAMGFTEPWLHQTPDEVIADVLSATARTVPWLSGITVERLKREGSLEMPIVDAPFADGRFRTPSGKVELLCEALATEGIDPLPGRFRSRDDDSAAFGDPALALELLTGASHHFVSSSLASQSGLLKGEGPPFVEIHPADAAVRGVATGDAVVLENRRGHVSLRAIVTDAVRPGVLVSPKGRWAKHNGGRNVNWTTSDALADLAGQSTFHSNRVWVRKVDSETS
ncbi:MAG TPA: molybdopterin oxidoreductase family protein [Gemmataceae bacterium]|nr:molybdopterin oxidoreductase family protein [Gemmataceae bacterium]